MLVGPIESTVDLHPVFSIPTGNPSPLFCCLSLSWDLGFVSIISASPQVTLRAHSPLPQCVISMSELEEIIYQNQLLQSEIDATEIPAVATVAPLPFDDTTYDPDDYTVDENRLASVRHRLQKR
jgi:hypothetical protein